MIPDRLGFGSKIVVTATSRRLDLPRGAQRPAYRPEILDGIDDVHFAMLTSHDVVRHRWSADRDAYETVAGRPGEPRGDRTGPAGQRRSR